MSESNYMDVSAGDILDSSGNFAEVANTAQNIVQSLQDGLANLAPIAGSDTYGQAFSAQFNPAVEAAAGVLTGVQGGMNKTVTDLQQTALLYTKSNEVNTDLAGS
jgi:ABC-type transporter Mla subunit MlaD